jgi:hypothetical protein
LIFSFPELELIKIIFLVGVINVDLLAAVRKYDELGIKHCPLKPRSKECRDADWLKREYSIEDYTNPKYNIGIRSVENLIVIDEDCPEVIALADYFLPPTKAIYGRKSKPRSKRLYRCSFNKMIAYRDVKQGVLVEIRYGHQDMAPPSIHPDGEKLEWDILEEITEYAPNVVVRSVKLLATSALVARYYNPPKNRHDWGLALSGLFRNLSMNEHEATLVIGRAGMYAKDQDTADRIRCVKSTFAKSEGDPVTASKTLMDLMPEGIGPDFIDSIRRIWGVQTSQLSKKIQEINEEWAFIFKGDVVCINDKDPKNIKFTRPRDLNYVLHEKVQVDINANGSPKLVKLGTAWLDSTEKRAYEGIELAPKNPRKDYYNLWKGWDCDPVKGDWSLFKQQIMECIACNDRIIYDYVVAWMADSIQNPDRQGFTAIVLRGGKGVGKSTFGEWFGSLFGVHFLEINSMGQLTGRFNAHFHNAILVFADEATWGGSRGGVGTLNRMITQNTLAIERKGFDIMTIKNHTHLIMAGNDKWIVPAGIDERRYSTFNMSDIHQNDYKFFAAVEKQLFEQGGREAMLYDLLEYKTDVNLRVIINTKSLQEQKEESLNALSKWWLEKLRIGRLLEGRWPDEVNYSALHEDFSHFADTHYFGTQRARKATESEIGRFLKIYAPGEKQRKMLKGGERQIFRKIPSLEYCRDVWFDLTGIDASGEDEY